MALSRLISLYQEWATIQNRRRFLAHGKDVLGFAAVSSLLGEAADARPGEVPTNFPQKAKRVTYLHMAGGPSQMDLFDYKPEMLKWYDTLISNRLQLSFHTRVAHRENRTPERVALLRSNAAGGRSRRNPRNRKPGLHRRK